MRIARLMSLTTLAKILGSLDPKTMLAPGATIGILGGGQLGRMLALSAAQLGFKCHIYTPEADSPAFDCAHGCTVGAYDDKKALAKFAAAIDVATYEFENIPTDTVSLLNEKVPVRPGIGALSCAQDRIAEKQLAVSLGARTAPFAEINSLEDLQQALSDGIAPPCILKTRRFGYDGKGQVQLSETNDAATAFESVGRQPSILEGFVSFKCEVSVVAARGMDGSFEAFPVTENEHRNHILHRSLVPARISDKVADEAISIARKFAEQLGYVGVLAIEFFVVDDDDGQQHVYVNEMAPRVHNSGHWTQDGAATSQFEQHIRAVAGWPLGSAALLAEGAEMLNLIGTDIERWQDIAADPGACLHHYGKAEIRAGRKMGHVNRRLSKRPS